MSSVQTSIAQELQKGKTVTYFTVGESMRPLLSERKTHVTVAPIRSVNRGDILLYIRKNGALVLHRCIKKDSEGYYMRGDNTCGLERIEKAQAVGVVTHIYRNEKRIDVSANGGYKVYSSLWNFIYPVRFVFMKAAALLRRLK